MKLSPEMLGSEYSRQHDYLMEVQAGQRDFLNVSGMLERAYEMVVHHREISLYHVSLNRGRMILSGGEPMCMAGIRFGERWIDHNGNAHTQEQRVVVAKTYKGVIFPCTVFEPEEVKRAVDLLDGLESLRAVGILPGLDETLNYIRSPESAIRPDFY